METALSHVRPGDLITAEFMNGVVDAIEAATTDALQFQAQIVTLLGEVADLAARVSALELAVHGSPPKGKESKDGKESKEGKETKEGKDTLEKIQLKDISDIRKVTKEIEKAKEVEKSLLADVRTPQKTVLEAIRTTPEKLSDAVSPVQHFISPALRPDLTKSALEQE